MPTKKDCLNLSVTNRHFDPRLALLFGQASINSDLMNLIRHSSSSYAMIAPRFSDFVLHCVALVKKVLATTMKCANSYVAVIALKTESCCLLIAPSF